MVLKCTIAAIGKLKAGPEQDLFERYVKRFNQSGKALGLSPISLVEHAESRGQTAEIRKAEEAKRLLAAGGANAHRIVMSEQGKVLTSDAFAHYVRALLANGTAEVVWMVGGPDGHAPETLAKAHLVLSLGAMTLPHGLARVVLAEQLYRATTILAGHPYHRA